TGSSNLALLVTPSDTSNGTLTERHYRFGGLFFCPKTHHLATADGNAAPSDRGEASDPPCKPADPT
ncbi:hypothetical protein, partial [Ralstonia pseudosolanacearum]